jgi:hypothetical protein
MSIRNRSTTRLLASALIVLLAGTSARDRIEAQARPTTRAAAPPCDQACLTAMVDAYLAALEAHDPARLPLARQVKFTENTGVLDVGEGLWVGVSEGPGTFKIYVPDPAAHQVGFFGVMKEFDRPVLLALRLRVENNQITEIEHLVARSLTDVGLKNLGTPRPGLLAEVPPAQRVSRAQLLTIAGAYYDSILHSSGIVAPFADDCERHENGLVASGSHERASLPPGASPAAVALARIRGLTCAAAMDTGYLAYITGIDLRRIRIADEQHGLVFALTMFRHRGNVRTLKILNVPGVDTIPMDFGPVDLQAAHIFKIGGGHIHEIEAMGYTLPYKSDAGW